AASAMTVVNRERPDLILLDLGLPAGDGFLVLERLRKIEAFATLPVLVITGRRDAETRKRVETMGVAPVLTKPVDTEVLLGAIRDACHGPDPHRRGRPPGRRARAAPDPPRRPLLRVPSGRHTRRHGRGVAGVHPGRHPD